jgi:hypothetical protein
MWVGGQGKAPIVLPRERLGDHCIGGWVDPGPSWMGAENLATTGIQSLDHPAHSQSLYRLNYPGPQRYSNTKEKVFCEI